MFDPDIAPSGSLLGLLQRGRGDGTLLALAEQRAEALTALEQCVAARPPPRLARRVTLALLRAPVLGAGRPDSTGSNSTSSTRTTWSTPTSSAPVSPCPSSGTWPDTAAATRCACCAAYAAAGGNWEWALDELALRDDDAGLRALAPAVLGRFPRDPQGDAGLSGAMREAYEPRPWRLWADDPEHGERVRAAQEQDSFDRWQRQLRPGGPAPGWSVRDVLEWAQQGLEESPRSTATPPPPAAWPRSPAPNTGTNCWTPPAGAPRRPAPPPCATSPTATTRTSSTLIEAAAADPSSLVSRAALESFSRMRSIAALERARCWALCDGVLGAAAARMLALLGGAEDADTVLAALRRTVQAAGADAEGLADLVEGVGRLSIRCAAPVLRHVYRETASSHLRGCAARALAATDPTFARSFAVECLWDCEEATRELAAHHAATADVRVLAQLRRLAADPAEEAEVQTAVRGRLSTPEPLA